MITSNRQTNCMTRAIRKTIIPGAVMLLSLLTGARVSAQTPTYPGPYWYVVASGGGGAAVPYQGWGWKLRFDSVMITYTVGESCIAFNHEKKFDVTEGFQQPDGYGDKPYDIFDAIEDLHFYPNPCRQLSFVNFTLNESFTNVTLKVFSMEGKQVYEDHFTCGDGNLTYQLATSQLSPGMYIVEVIGFTRKRYIGKLVVIP